MSKGYALDLVRSRPDSRNRDDTEPALLTAILAPLGAVDGYGSPRVYAAQQRAMRLTRALGGEPAPPMLRSLAIGGLIRGEPTPTERLTERFRRSSVMCVARSEGFGPPTF